MKGAFLNVEESRQHIMKCPYCDTYNPPTEEYCTNCGGYLGSSPAAATSTSSNVPGLGTTSAGSAGQATSSTTAGGTHTTSGSLAPGGHLQGSRYVIKKILGQGGMGAAVLANDMRVTDHFQEGSHYFMVQEFVDGENLEDRLDRTNQPLPEQDALTYASQVLDILDYLEQQKPPIVHRDIKPANIIIGSKDKRAHLVDFGIARADTARNVKRKQTSALGTPGYAPPEQYQGNADPRSDLYALAATLHHVLTNRDPRNHPPFTYPPVRALNPQLSPEIEKVLARALINDINQRYQSAAAMKKDIDDILFKRFGVSGNISSYTLGTSGPMSAAGGASAAIAPAAPYQPDRNQPYYPPPVVPYQAPQRQQQPVPPPPPRQGAQGTRQNPPPVSVAARQPQQQQGNSYVLRSLLLLILVAAIIGGIFFAIPYFRAHPLGQSTNPGTTPSINTTTTTLPAKGLGTITAPDGESIGISDGTVAFATGGPGGSFKMQAADKLKAGDTVAAQSLWHSALTSDSGDAESLIYLEDQRVLNAHVTSNTGFYAPYVTIVVATMMTGDN